jgi:hypothetical protein
MKESIIKIRFMKVEDLNAIVRINEIVLKTSRSEYYRLKLETAMQQIFCLRRLWQKKKMEQW